ncbi:hypothetical protein FIU97_11515 [Roseivivax sp. THAF40]|uniref:hypothetical protein n=1 Tax=unclassified Roseivivax TaxID=2639302 RepID=UPI001268BE32|nr:MULTISPECIES: hypothetical protein [unclassified Roseivivax]QFS83458.1 hypothetical protein FIV09_11525 [Roseivivax sp. THAF197b]QFT47203.1 hypothetical protein FIU97_11515 [Roseivivax sp. THAF40]
MLSRHQLTAASKAKEALVAGQMQLWNLRLTAAVDAGDAAALREVIAGGIANTPNNCQCNSPQCNLIGDMLGGGRLRR